MRRLQTKLWNAGSKPAKPGKPAAGFAAFAGLLPALTNLLSNQREELIMEFNWVTTRLSVGPNPQSVADVEQLVQAGMSHCINCCDEIDDSPFLAPFPQVAYLRVPTADDGKPKPAFWFGRAIPFAFDALRLPGTRLYVHCAGGINRGPSMALAILLAWGIAELEAVALLKNARPQVGIAYRKSAVEAVKILGYV